MMMQKRHYAIKRKEFCCKRSKKKKKKKKKCKVCVDLKKPHKSDWCKYTLHPTDYKSPCCWETKPKVCCPRPKRKPKNVKHQDISVPVKPCAMKPKKYKCLKCKMPKRHRRKFRCVQEKRCRGNRKRPIPKCPAKRHPHKHHYTLPACKCRLLRKKKGCNVHEYH